MTRILLCLAFLAAPLAVASDVPPPQALLGFEPGADRQLAGWAPIVAWFEALDAASPRVRVANVGPTTEGLPFLVVTITSEANMARLEEIRRDNLRLADPRGLSDEEAAALVARGKTVVALNHGIHSTEVAGTYSAIETARMLATSNDPAVLQVLDETVILMLPSHNPDGTQKVAEWYGKTLGTPFEGASPPFLYQKYVGHDNNRDWYMFTQAESRLTVAHVYDAWRPQIVHDVHQMGSRAARLFLPPYVDPWEPNVDPALRTAVAALGTHMAAALTSQGKPGVVVNAIYDAWTPARAYPHTHGGVRVLSEAASAKLASPVDVPFAELARGIGYDPKVASWNFPDPWRGGAWRVRDIMDYQVAANLALLGHAARNRDYWLRTFLAVGRRAVAPRRPFAYVLPGGHEDPLAAAELRRVLLTGGVELFRATEPFTAGGRTFSAGAYVVGMAQPYGAFAKMLLERQHYPDIRPVPGAPPQRPYDVTAHTLPLLLGVEAVAVDEPFEAATVPVADARVVPGRVEGRGRFLAFDHGPAGLRAAGRLLRAGIPVRWSTSAFTDDGRRYEAGTLLAPGSARGAVDRVAQDLGVVAEGIDATPTAYVLHRPRVALYQSFVPSMDEGWTRFVFEHQAEVEYTTVHDAEVRAGGLRERFDAIVLADQSAAQIRDGHAAGSLPAEYTGGLGPEGAKALKAFVQEGGTLVALDSATAYAVTELGLLVKDALAGLGPASADDDEGAAAPAEFYSPGAILETRGEGGSPIGHGLAASTPVWFESSPAFDVKSGRVVLRYPHADPLLSGWLLGEEYLRGKAALVDVSLGRGRVVLFGFRPQYRAQSWATYVPLLNALYLSAARPSAD
ncbi:MAG: M14 metallopeptidase family protein [Vicinamibacteria bacterium]